MRIQSVGCRQGPSGVADVAGLGLAFIVCAVDVEIEAQRLVGCQWDGVVAVQVILTIDVFEFSTVQGGAEVIGDCVAAPNEIGALGGLACIGCVEFAARLGGGALLAFGEVARFEIEPFEFAALQLEAGRGLREQAAAAGGEDRSGRLQRVCRILCNRG
ncbi:hypothetical protein CSC41_5758 [Pseudomonas aeruginosa]|nr:hypothetical protein CSC41_5758 [Pseudomonas aeruginosa]